jgi:hypothetical protein
MAAKADDDLILVAYDTSAWTRADIEEFTRRWLAEMAWECRGEPDPLPIDGREYHRRQLARKRRRRRGR